MAAAWGSDPACSLAASEIGEEEMDKAIADADKKVEDVQDDDSSISDSFSLCSDVSKLDGSGDSEWMTQSLYAQVRKEANILPTALKACVALSYIDQAVLGFAINFKTHKVP